MSTRREIVFGAAVALTVAITHAAVAETINISKGERTTSISGSGWPAGVEVEIVIGTPDAPIGTVVADAGGNIKTSWHNLTSPAAIGLKVGNDVAARTPDPSDPNQFIRSPTITVTRDPKASIWTIILEAIDEFFSIANTIEHTELASAGFVPSGISLTAISSNAQILDEDTIFDPSTDIITTIGDYRILDFGPVLGTYAAAGIFLNLSDPQTGDVLPPFEDVFSFTEQIGQVIRVPAPLSLALLGTGAVGVILLSRWRSWILARTHLGMSNTEGDGL